VKKSGIEPIVPQRENKTMTQLRTCRDKQLAVACRYTCGGSGPPPRNAMHRTANVLHEWYGLRDSTVHCPITSTNGR
jgi:hypothetical protein